MSQSMLSRLYAGEPELGMETLQRIIRKYPELAVPFLAQNMPASSGVSL